MKKLAWLLLLTSLAQAAPPPWTWGPDNKALDFQAGIYTPQSGTPVGSPASGYDYLYFKSDDHLYLKTSAGVETQVDGGGSSLAMGAFGSSPNDNGGTIATGTLTLQPADGTHPGGLSIGAQTIAGAKTLTGVLAVPVGAANLPSLYFGDADTGLWAPAANTVAVSTNAAEVFRVGTAGIALGTTANTDNAKLTIKNVGADTQTALQLVSNSTAKVGMAVIGATLDFSDGTVPFFGYDITNTLMSLGYNAGAPRFRLSMDSASTSTNPTGIVSGGSSVLPPVMVMRSTSATAGNYGGVANTGSSNIVNGWAVFYNDTQTSSSEDSHFAIATAAAGTRTEKFKISNKGQVTHAGTAPAAGTCGTSPGAPTGNDNVFKITSGTGGVSTSCAVTLTIAPATGGHCHCTDETSSATIVVDAILTTSTVTMSTYSRTTGIAAAFVASDVFSCSCLYF